MKGIRLKELREKKGLNQSDLAKLLNISASAIGMYETDKREPDDNLKIKFANFFNVTVDYLMGNESNNKKLLPVLGVVKAGYNYLAQENILEYIDPAMDLPDNQEYFALIVKGDSMYPIVNEGDYLLVKKDDGNFINNDVCIVLINGDEATVKKVIRTDTGIELHAYNPYYPVQKYTFKEMQEIPVTIIGTVIRLIRKFK